MFTTYHSNTLKAKVGQPTGASETCLSCHDGTVAVNVVGNRARLGTDLSHDHPISFTYDSALANANGELFDPATKTVPSLGGKTIQKALLIDNQLQCCSCHDVHRIKGDSASNRCALVVKNNRDDLCLTCHNK